MTCYYNIYLPIPAGRCYESGAELFSSRVADPEKPFSNARNDTRAPTRFH